MRRRNSQPRSKRRHSDLQSQNERVYQVESDEERYVGDEELPTEGTTNGGSRGFHDLDESQQNEVKKRCIRYMLCRNARKRPVKRAELSKYMFYNMENIGKKHRMFSGAFEVVQQELRTIFGMEMVEVSKLVKARKSTHATLTQTASQVAGSSTTKGYILISVLPQEGRVEDTDSTALTGFITVLAALILLSPGCRLEEQELYNALKRIGVHVREVQGHKQLNGGNVKELLEKTLIDQWYFEREKEDNTTFYTLGPRLRAEVSDDDLLEFVNAVYKQGSDSRAVLDEAGRAELKMRLNSAWGPDGAPEEDR